MALGGTFFTVNESATAVVVSNHERAPVFIAVEGKPCAAWPLVPNRPQHCDSVLFVERILCVNEQKSPFFFSFVKLPHVLHSVNGAFNS